MKIRKSAIVAILGAAVASVGFVPPVSVSAADVYVPATQLATPAGTVQSGDRLIGAINKAEDPSSAINAYADAKAAEPNNLAVQQAYLRKMVEFQLPEMAEAQAKEIINKDTRDALAWAVLAYMHAKEDMTTQALTEISVAEQRAPDDPFVMRTAGQLVAWYDLRSDKSQIPEAVKNSVEAMRKDLAGKPVFADTYAKATEAYREAAANPATQPTENTGTTYVPPPTITPTPTENYTPTYTPTTYGYPEYPYYTSYAPYYQPWYPYGYFYPSAIIVSSGFGFGFHHHHHHHDGFVDGFHHHHEGFDFDHDGDGLPLVHSHHWSGVAGGQTSAVNAMHEFHHGISVPERAGAVSPMERPSVIRSPGSGFVRGGGGGATVTHEGGVEVIRGPSHFEQHSTPEILSAPMHVPTRAQIGGGLHSAPSVSVPMRSVAPAPAAPMAGPHIIGPTVQGGGIGGMHDGPMTGPGAGGGRR